MCAELLSFRNVQIVGRLRPEQETVMADIGAPKRTVRRERVPVPESPGALPATEPATEPATPVPA